MPRRRTGLRRSARARWGWALVLSALLQVPMVYVFSTYVDTPTEPVERPPTRLRLVRYEAAPEVPRPEPEPAPIPEDARIVEVPEVVEPEREPEPRETRNLSNRKVRVKKQTRSERVAPPDPSRHAGKVRVEKPSAVQSRRSDSADPTVTDQEQTEQAMAGQREDRPATDAGQQRPKSIMDEGADAEILMPVTTERARIANLQGMSGDFSTDDHLPDVTERDRHTLLDADKYRFFDFFDRVKDAVRRHWHPDRVYRMRDPTGRVFGVKDRYTVLKVTLDDAGRLKRTVTMRQSGLDFMDSEAHAAFKRARHFPNPPRGLVDPQGEVNFQFGFYFEISSGRSRFRWKRL